MSFLSEQERELILDLLRGRIPEEEFFRAFPIQRGQGSSTGRAILVRALHERDATGVEFGLYLAHRFGISEQYLDVLLELAGQSWHQRHEDVIDALAKLKSPSSVEVLFRTAVTRFPYREYDEANSLGVKSIWALGKIRTKEALGRLGDLMATGDAVLQQEAEHQLLRIVNEGPSEEARARAREILADWRSGRKA